MQIEFHSDIFVSYGSGASQPGAVFAGIDQYNDELARRYAGFRNQRGPQLGWYVLRDAAVTDHWGIVYEPGTGITPVLLPGFGWQREHLEYAAARGTIAITKELPPHAAVGPMIETHVGTAEIGVPEPVYLLSWPGALTYGHWITDFIGRMEIAQRQAGRSCRFLTPGPVQPWMKKFFGLYGIAPDQLILLDKTVTYRCAELIVPTIMCHMPGGTLPVEFLKPIFDRHRDAIGAWLPEPRKAGGIVFLRHTRMTSPPDRELANAGEAASLIECLGGAVMDPLGAPAGELVAAINAAKIVIGQDSSALHNLVFAKPVGLVVIETQPRANLLHASIQELAGGLVSYFKADPRDGAWVADLGRLEQHLRAFDQHIARR